MRGRTQRLVVGGLAVIAGVGCQPAPTADPDPGGAPPAPVASPVRPQLDGRGFPDHVLALTWDDGPDAHTLDLAAFLAREHVSATFFVVREWAEGLSADPGSGDREFETGYRYLPVLGDLVGLGHRIGNHTSNHVLLTEVSPDVADREIEANQEAIDPFLTNELRLFRAPGGAWGAGPSRATDADPYLLGLVGPIRWDVDRKDWESSLSCRSTRASECEASGGKQRVRPEVVARRYLASIEEARHGVVLFHDRVGDVGSSYALDVARRVVPELSRRGYVFAAPVLGFVEASPRLASIGGAPAGAALELGDLDGDGRADACVCAAGDRRCALSAELPGTDQDRRPHTVFLPAAGGPAPPARALDGEAITLADVDGDGRADLCAVRGLEVECALASDAGEPAGPRRWSSWSGDRAVVFGDVDGDGRADLCAGASGGVECARSTGHSFGPPRAWLAPGRGDGALTGPRPGGLALADVDGDGRADACWVTARGIACARSRGLAFGSPEVSGEEAPPGVDRLLMGDINGDGRADACWLVARGVACALSTGSGFTRASVWLGAGASPAAASIVESESLALGDVNGDRRADLCGYGARGVSCALAP